MNKRDLNNIRMMFDNIDGNMLRIECLAYLVQNLVILEQAWDEELDFGTLTIILNDTIKQSRKNILKLDRYLIKLEN